MHTTKILAALTVATSAVALAACADPTTNTTSAGQSATAASSNTAAYDVSQIPTDPTIAALVPEEVKKRGTLRNGASTGYAPAEYMATDGQTPIGYDIDINKALAKVMGLEEGTTQHSDSRRLSPPLAPSSTSASPPSRSPPSGSNRSTWFPTSNVGSAWGVATGNPKSFDTSNPCGTTIAVQTGTAQETYAQELSKQCEADGKGKITIMPHELQTDIATKIISGQYDATLADSTVIGYTAAGSNGKIEQLGRRL